MAQFPVDSQQGVQDGVNYLLSGPAGLGQYFNGFSSSMPTTVTANYRPPFTTNTTTHICTGVYGDSTITVQPDINGIIDMSGISIGQTAIGIGIAGGTTITNIVGSVITLSNTIDANINYYISFTNFAAIYVAPISLGVCQMLDGYTWKYFFSVIQSLPPFQLGNPITIDGVTDDWYNGQYQPIGVVECTTSYVIVKSNTSYAIHSPSSGGTASYANTNQTDTAPLFISTDCNAKVVVNGGTDRVFLSASIDANFTGINLTVGISRVAVTTAINRYVGVINNDPTNPEYRFFLDKTIAQKVHYFQSILSYNNYEDDIAFTSVIDIPKPGYYWYILERSFNVYEGDYEVTTDYYFTRSLTAQVVKQ